MTRLPRSLCSLAMTLTFPFLLSVSQAFAKSPSKLGVHILEPEEIKSVSALLPNGGYVTVPMRIDQLDQQKWQGFFDDADRAHLVPIVRLMTTFEQEFWKRPTKRDIVVFSQFLNTLDWHRGELIVVAFNEPNHAGEWGGSIDPVDYGETLTFLVDWFNTEQRAYRILPAALDQAANSTAKTVPANEFLRVLVDLFPETLKKLDGWNSHAYPNPAFAGLPTDAHAMSVRSYQHELSKLNNALSLSLPIYITETGWDNTRRSTLTISHYFKTAYERVWASDDRVVAVTPFLFNAQARPFSVFSLLDRDQKPTVLFETIKKLAS